MIREEIRLSRHIKHSFIFAVTLLIGLAFVNLYVTQQRIRTRESDSTIINLSGKQRMYSQKVAKDALLVQTAPDSATLHQRIGELKRDLAAWRAIYSALLYRGRLPETDSLRIAGENSREVTRLIHLHEPHRDAMMNAVRQVISATQLTDTSSQKAEIRRAVQVVLVHEPYVLRGRDEITRQYTREANAALAELSNLIRYTTICIVSILLLQALLLFHPLEKLIRNFLRQQGETIEELRQQQQELRATHDELSATSAFQHAVLQSALVSVIAVDLNGLISSMNQTAVDWLGYQPDELVGVHSPIIIHLEEEITRQATRLSVELQQTIAPNMDVFVARTKNGLPNMEEWTYVRKDGSTFPVLLTISAIRNKDGDITGYLGVGVDISEKKKIETVLREKEQLYRLLSKNTRDVIRLHRLDGTYEYVSPSVQDLLGYAPEELTGTNPVHLIYPDDRRQTLDYFSRQIQNGFTSESIEYRLMRKNGTPVWVETVSKPVVDERGQLQYIQTSSRDISRRKQAEQVNKQLSQLLSGVLDSSLSGIMAFRSVRSEAGELLDFEWIQVNARAEQMVGKTAAELLGKHLLQEMPGNREEGLFDRYVRVVETGEPLNHEHYYEHEGLKTWFHTVAVKLADGFTVTFSNITDRKQAELEVAESSRFIHALFEHSPLPIQVFDRQGFSMQMNEARRKFLGIPDKTYGVGVFNVLTDPLHVVSGADASFQRAYEGETVMLTDQFLDLGSAANQWETTVRAVYYDHIIYPILDAGGKTEAVVSFIQDTTYKVEAQREIEEARWFMESVAQTMPDYLYVFDIEQFTILYANQQLTLALGTSEMHLRHLGSQAISFHVHPDDQAPLQAYYEQFCHQADGLYANEFRVKNHLGEYRLWRTREVPFRRNAQGLVTQIVGAAQDITDAREAELKLQQAYQELQVTEEELRSRGEELLAMNEVMEQTIQQLRAAQSQLVQSEKMASLGQLTAGIAHEINNPINFVYAGADNLKQSLRELYLILEKYEIIEKLSSATQIAEQLAAMPQVKQELFYEENKENILQTIDSIEDGAARTAEIVKGLRNFSRLDEAAVKYANIHEGIDSTLILLTSQTKNRITVFKHYAPDIPAIECYPGQLNQVFMNILSNAAQAIEGEGEITIRTENLPETIHIYLQDSGSGMSAETQAKIFDPFFTTKPVGKGTGLGLAISYSIIRKHQGSIHVSSTPDVGTTFTITLPKKLSE